MYVCLCVHVCVHVCGNIPLLISLIIILPSMFPSYMITYEPHEPVRPPYAILAYCQRPCCHSNIEVVACRDTCETHLFRL